MSETRVTPNGSAAAAVRGAALSQVAEAVRALRTARPSAEQVHIARKAIKKSRAALRLLRATLAKVTYQRENQALRAAAHALDPVRDATVLLRALTELRARRATLTRDRTTATLTRSLQQRQRQAQHDLRSRPERLAAARSTLDQVQARARRWHVGHDGWTSLGPAFRRIYRRGRRAAQHAERRADAPTLHDWRKQIQYLRHAWQILEPLQSKIPAKAAHRARQVAEYLGEDHDLALLRAATSEFTRQHHLNATALLAAIDRRRKHLQTRAMPIGRHLYVRRSRRVAARLIEGRS
ncbi:MAG TPA: CHAD domain-containing protein [Steroidobacteraceae bacterium]|jgi:CHAD domain-containing protein